MATTAHTILAGSLADLETQVNAYLVTFIGGSARIVRGLSVVQIDDNRLASGASLQAIITLDSTAVPAMATPFAIKTFSERNATDLDAALATWLAANPAAFVTGVRCISQADLPRLTTLSAWAVINATSGASANWLPT